jgi:hypothetical protein
MASASDTDTLSEYQCLLRELIEYFEATAEDANLTTQGRNKAIFHGQVRSRSIRRRG